VYLAHHRRSSLPMCNGSINKTLPVEMKEEEAVWSCDRHSQGGEYLCSLRVHLPSGIRGGDARAVRQVQSADEEAPRLTSGQALVTGGNQVGEQIAPGPRHFRRRTNQLATPSSPFSPVYSRASSAVL